MSAVLTCLQGHQWKLETLPALGGNLCPICGQDARTLPPAEGTADLPPTGRQLPAGETQAVRYLPIRLHAKGGLGEVYLATDTELNREVALKRIQEQYANDGESRRRFLVEAEVTARLEHPGVVPVHGLVKDEAGQPIYAMRFIQGEPLGDAIKAFHERRGVSPPVGERRGVSPPVSPGPTGELTLRRSRQDFDSLEFRQLLQRFIAVCNTIAYAHSRGIIHRDLKPGNVMLGKYGETVVVDWGLAKAVGGAAEQRHRPEFANESTLAPTRSVDPDSGTQLGLAVGTPAYMSPEQAAGRWDIIGPASDIYALGATLYSMLTDRPPFTESNLGLVLFAVQQGDFKRPRQLNPKVPPALEAICLRAMALRPADRYPTPQDLAGDIEHWLADEPVSAHGEPVLVRAGRWMRKHRTLVTSCAAVLFVATIGSMVAALIFGGLNRQLESANADLRDANAKLETANASEKAARAEAQANAEKAKTEAATATAVKNFLQRDLLKLAAASKQHEQAATGVKMDPDLKVRDLVLRAAEKIEGKFPDQPLVEAEIRWTLGWTLLEIGRADLAIAQFLRVRELYTAKRGPDHPDTLMSMNNLANSYADAGRTQEALKLREETLQLRKAKLGPDHADTLSSMNNLAASYAAAGRTKDALTLDEETLKLRKAKLGPDHPDTLVSMNNLASSYADAGRTQDALTLEEETLKLRKAKLGPDHPDTLLSMNNLASSYYAAGRNQEALKLFEETLRLQKAKLGPDHPDTLMSMNNLANSYIRLGQAAEAQVLMQQALALRQRRLNADPGNSLEQSFLAWTHGQMGEAEQLRHEYAAAVKAYARSVETFEKLDQAGALKDPFFRGLLNRYRQRLALSRKAERAVKDLDFALAQPAAEVPGLLDLRVRFLLKEQKLPAAVETAAKMKELAGDLADRLYDAACLYALCAGAKNPLPDGRGSEKLAEEAMALLKQAVAKGYKNAGHMKQDTDLDALRGREDFRKLLAEPEAGKANEQP